MPAKKKTEVKIERTEDIIEPHSDDEQPEIKVPDPPPPPPPEPIVKKKKGRTMTPGALEQLKRARETALANKKKLMEERAMNTPVENPTTSKPKNNPSNIDVLNQKFEILTDKFNQFLDDKAKRREQKQDLKKKYQDELPGKVNKSLLENELKERELAAFRKRMFGF